MRTKHDRRKMAIELAEERLRRSPNEQLAELDKRPGQSARERARLQRYIDAGNGNVRGLAQYKTKKGKANGS